MKIEDVIGLLILGTWVGMLALEALFPARPIPGARMAVAGAFFLLLYLAVGTVCRCCCRPRCWKEPPRSLRLGIAGGVIVGFALQTLVGYWYHRACHRWRDVALAPPAAPQRPPARHRRGPGLPPLRDGGLHPDRGGRAGDAAGDRSAGRRPVGFVPSSTGCSSTSTFGRPGSSATSSSGPSRTASTTRRACTPATTAIFPCGTCCSGPSRTRARFTAEVGLGGAFTRRIGRC